MSERLVISVQRVWRDDREIAGLRFTSREPFATVPAEANAHQDQNRCDREGELRT